MHWTLFELLEEPLASCFTSLCLQGTTRYLIFLGKWDAFQARARLDLALLEWTCRNPLQESFLINYRIGGTLNHLWMKNRHWKITQKFIVVSVPPGSLLKPFLVLPSHLCNLNYCICTQSNELMAFEVSSHGQLVFGKMQVSKPIRLSGNVIWLKYFFFPGSFCPYISIFSPLAWFPVLVSLWIKFLHNIPPQYSSTINQSCLHLGCAVTLHVWWSQSSLSFICHPLWLLQMSSHAFVCNSVHTDESACNCWMALH